MTPKASRPGRRHAQVILISIAFLLAFSSSVHAQCPANSPSPTPTPTPASTQKNNAAKKPAAGNVAQPTLSPTPTASPTPYPLSIEEVRVPDKNPAEAGLGDEVVVKVQCLKEELERQENPKNGVPTEGRIDPKKFVLFLNQIEINKLYPYIVDRVNGELHFRLRRDTDSRDAWLNFLARPSQDVLQLDASVGPEGKSPLTGAQKLPLRIYSKTLLKVGVILFVAVLIGFLIAARKTTIIRDSGPPNPDGGPRKRPYSLARTQVAWWFFIILGSFLFIGLVTWGDFDTITSSSLVLLGIGTGTALGAAMVDANKRESTDKDLETLKPKEAQLTASIAELKTTIMNSENIALGGDPSLAASLAARRTELATLEAELEQVRTQVNDAASGLQKPVSDGPIMDLLSDVNGVTFHRFQIVVWTIVLGLIFLHSVWVSLTMPQFSDTLLALMGISAGTYVGFKIPERQTDPADATTTNASTNLIPADNTESSADTEPQSEEEGC